jgi:Arc/MetJ-type ribon-helix-helix transcriptional regulator
MPISVRLDERTERVIRRLAKQTGRTKSDVIRQAISTLETQERAVRAGTPTAYDRLAHLIGGPGSGGARLSEATGDKFRALVEGKHRARRPR